MAGEMGPWGERGGIDEVSEAKATLDDPGSSMEERAVAHTLLALNGTPAAASGVIGGAARGAMDAARRITPTLQEGAKYGAFGHLASIPVALGDVAYSTAKGAIDGIPGPNPQEFTGEITPEQQLAERAGASARAGQLAGPQPPSSTAASLGVSGNFGAPMISANTGGLRAAAGRFDEMGAKTAGSIEAAGERLQGALGQSAAAEGDLIQAEAERANQAAAQAQEKVGLTDDYVQGIRAAEQERQSRLAAHDAELKRLRDSERYHRMAPEQVAELVDRRESLNRDLAAGFPNTVAGVAEMERKRLDLEGVEKRLQKASEMRGEWDFDNPGEVFAAIAMSLAQGLGAFGSAMTGAPNFAMQIAQTRAKRITDAQKDEIARRQGRTEGEINDFDRYMKVFGDERAAEQSIYLGELAKVDAALSSLSMGTSSEETKARIEKAHAENQAKQAEVEMEIKTRAGKAASDAMAQSTGILTDATKLELSAKQANQDNMAMQVKMRQDAAQKGGELVVPGPWGGVAVNEGSHKEARQFGSYAEQAISQAQTLKAMRDDPAVFIGMGQTGTDAFKQAKQAWSRLVNSLKQMEGMGANFTAMEKELIELQIGDDPTSVTRQIAPLMDTLVSSINREAPLFMKYRLREGTQRTDDLGEVAR